MIDQKLVLLGVQMRTDDETSDQLNVCPKIISIKIYSIHSYQKEYRPEDV